MRWTKARFRSGRKRGTSRSATRTTSDAKARVHHAAGRPGAPRTRCDGADDPRTRGARRRAGRARRRLGGRGAPGERARAAVPRPPQGRPRPALRGGAGARARPEARRRRRAHVPDLRGARRAARAAARDSARPLVHALACSPTLRPPPRSRRRWRASTAVPSRSIRRRCTRSATGSTSRSSRAATIRQRDGLRLLALGRYSPAKGLDVMLRALRRSLDRGLDVRLTVHGPTLSELEREHRRELLELRDELRLGDRAELGGPVDRSQVPELLAANDLLVNNMRAGEAVRRAARMFVHEQVPAPPRGVRAPATNRPVPSSARSPSSSPQLQELAAQCSTPARTASAVDIAA